MTYLKEAPRYQVLFQKELQGHRERKFVQKRAEEIIQHGLSSVIFDLDSTLMEAEGIDKLASLRGDNVRERIEQMTREGMSINGNTAQSFLQKYDIVRPTEQELIRLGKECIDLIVEDAKEVVDLLRGSGKKLIIESGGMGKVVKQVTDYLGFPEKDVFANDVIFDTEGNYLGLDIEIPLWTKTGKPLITRRLIEEGRITSDAVMVGDGGTDAETRHDLALFVGYGGVVERSDVAELSPFYIKSQSLAPLAVIVLGEDGWKEAMKNPKHAEILKKGFDLILSGQVVFKDGFEILPERIEGFLVAQVFDPEGSDRRGEALQG